MTSGNGKESELFPEFQIAIPLTLHESIGILLLVALAFAYAVSQDPPAREDRGEYRLIRIMLPVESTP